MEIVWILIPFAILLAGFFIAGFFWMVGNGQYDDLDTPHQRMLLDNDKKIISPNINDNKDRK